MIYTLTLNPALDRELTVPEIREDEVLRATHIRVDWGGKGFNVSRALAALGQPSVALGLVGGTVGEKLRAGLEASGIQLDLLTVAGESRVNVSIVGEQDGRVIKVNEPGPRIAPAELHALTEKIRELARPGDWWVLSGSLPPGVPGTFYADLIAILQVAGARALVDTSGEPLRHACMAGPFLVKPNVCEAAELTGIAGPCPDNAGEVVCAIHALGAMHVLLTAGDQGAWLSDGMQAWRAIPPVIEEANPVGAGDSLLAGVVWALAQELPSAEVLRWGVACGATAASLPGTGVGRYAQVAALVPQVIVEG